MTTINERSYDALIELADVRVALGDARGALAALESAVFIDPTDIGQHARVADLAERLGDTARLIRERRAIVALAPPDRAEALYQLARAYLLGGDRPAARRTVLRALELAPSFAKAQDLLLELAAGRRE
jgi:tetratricopeptide (TPR) repeat protein